MSVFTAYKYVGADRAVQCLEDGTLYLASPGQLNDALEACFSTASTQDYLEITEATFAEVARQRSEAPLAFEWNALPDFAEVNQRENERFQAFCKEVGICALARRPNHQAMWAYYGEGGQGICLELGFTRYVMEANQLLVGPVIYSNKERVLNRAEDWRVTFLELAEQFSKATIQELQQMSLTDRFRRRMGLRMAQRATSVKHTDWRHEDEIRLLGPKGGKPLPVLGQVLMRVHFREVKALSRIAPLLVKRYPGVELMQWTFQHGKLQAKDHPMEFRLIPMPQ